MNIKKNAMGFKGITRPTYITKSWRKTSGYKTRGYKLRRRRVGINKIIINNPEITKYIKRNRVWRLVKHLNA